MVQLRPWFSVAVLSYALPLDKALRYLQIFLSSLFSSHGDAAYASIPVIDALTIRDKKIRRLIACNLHSISVLLLPLKEYRPPRRLALPKIFPKGTSDVSRHCSPYRRILGTIFSFRRFCLYLSSASVSSSDDALFMMMALADSAMWSGKAHL